LNNLLSYRAAAREKRVMQTSLNTAVDAHTTDSISREPLMVYLDIKRKENFVCCFLSSA
jgi:hypothetical protein